MYAITVLLILIMVCVLSFQCVLPDNWATQDKVIEVDVPWPIVTDANSASKLECDPGLDGYDSTNSSEYIPADAHNIREEDSEVEGDVAEAERVKCKLPAVSLSRWTIGDYVIILEQVH